MIWSPIESAKPVLQLPLLGTAVVRKTLTTTADLTGRSSCSGHRNLQSMAARDDLEPRNPREIVFAIAHAWQRRLRMQTEYRMNEYSLAE